ncbi:SGNH/GDSL hydrolase family protein [Alteromonas flava]|uniref:SGNH/GDSL hydrolase family protein n=1 Tax=Alteromonas flava TaxID=2048003 RepID=UPI000C291B85|nr:SGNH/GDSL hydrolase family protein [Alteromonas flava]
MANNQRATRPVYYLIMLALPALVLLGAEGALRLFGFGQHYPLFIPTTHSPGLLQPNPAIIQRYFHHPAAAPNVAPDTFIFTAQKPKDTLRLVVMGGSTAAGFPYGRFGSPTGMLQHQLKQLYPERDIEVISVAMASINSYALRDFSAEVAALEPDAVLIYAGHNEYLGVMGVGSVYAGAGGHLSNLMLLNLKSSRLFQLLQSLLYPAPNKTAIQTGRTVMATVAKDTHIPLNSELYNAGIAQFRNNMQAVIKTFQEHGIPVYLSNLVSNEQHQPPFESLPESAGLSASARLNFSVANERFNAGEVKQAHQFFQTARDLDLLRFRAPSQINTEIARLTEADGVYLVNSEQIVRDDTTHGIIGKVHMLEHLHPTARGYFKLAYAFLLSLQRHELLPSVSDFSPESLWQTIPLTEVDHQFAELKVQQLISDYPFQAAPVPFSLPVPDNDITRFAIARFNGQAWLEQQSALLTYYQEQQNPLRAATVASVMADALHANHQAENAASQLYRQANQLTLSQYHARRAVNLVPTSFAYRMHYAQVLYLGNNLSAARLQLRKALEIEPVNPQAKHYLQQINQQMAGQ